VALAFVGIGSNLGDSVAAIRASVDALGALGSVERVSSLYRTPPWGNTEQPDFVNAVAALRTELAPRALLAALKDVERQLGRDDAGERWGPRTIDLDILIYGDERVDEPGLAIPHRHLSERAFALVPLAEIEPSYAPMRDALGAQALSGVRRLDDARRYESP
jgi:2-amino-4-hydroxy-6-hydroxymethyldihydropteridine diphosphokinase